MYWKVLTHDYHSPIQGGEPIFDGTLPHQLPMVALDTGSQECAAGWNFTDNLATALRIGRLWPDGWPSTAFEVEPSADMIRRGDKHRASSLRLMRAARPEEISDAVLELSAAFGDHAATMHREQMAWRTALARPQRDKAAVVAGLKKALTTRSLDWTSKEFLSARDAWAAWAAWAARDARDAWDAWAAWAARDARAARDAWAAWDARAARAARAARDAWDAWDAWAARDARDAWDAWAARDARAALIVHYASVMGWTKDSPDLLAVGIRDAYESGLDIALPTGPQELGYAMVKK